MYLAALGQNPLVRCAGSSGSASLWAGFSLPGVGRATLAAELMSVQLPVQTQQELALLLLDHQQTLR